MTYQSVLPRLAEAGIISLGAHERQEIEDEIERLIGLLDACDAPIEDMEPEDDKGADDYGEPEEGQGKPQYGVDQRLVLNQMRAAGVERYRHD